MCVIWLYRSVQPGIGCIVLEMCAVFAQANQLQYEKYLLYKIMNFLQKDATHSITKKPLTFCPLNLFNQFIFI